MKREIMEADIQSEIIKYLKKLPGLWLFKVCGGSTMQKAGIPDIVGVYQGQFFAIEVKRPGKKPTTLQKHVMETLARCGALVGIAVCVGDAQKILGIVSEEDTAS